MLQTYIGWLFKQRSRQDEIGEFALYAFCRTEWDGKQHSLKREVVGTRYEETYYSSLVQFRRWTNGRGRPAAPTPTTPESGVEEPAPAPAPEPEPVPAPELPAFKPRRKMVVARVRRIPSPIRTRSSSPAPVCPYQI